MGKAHNILVVDESDEFVAQFQNALLEQPERFEIATVKTLVDACRLLSSSSPDLIVAAWLLPDGKGIDLLTGGYAGPFCPVIITSEHGDVQSAVSAIKAGAADYIDKSVLALPEVVALVTQVCHERSVSSVNKGRLKVNAGEEKFRNFFECAAAGMVTISPDRYFMATNAAFCGFVGYSAEELSRMQVADITHPDDLGVTDENYRMLVSGQIRAIDYQKRFLRKTGEVAWGHVSVVAVLDESAQPQYYVGLVQDITESRQIQNQVRESQQMLQLILDYIPQYVFWKDRDSVYRGCNRNFARAAGVETPQNLIGKTDFDLPWTQGEAEFYRECDRRVMASDLPELHIIETQLQANGRQAWLDTNKIPLHDGDGQVVGILGTFEDITERKRAEDQLLERNRELDAFVYTVSHDLRTPLTPIISYAEVLQTTCREQLDEQSLDCLAKIENQGRRMQAVMEDLLVLAKVGHVQRPTELVDADAVLDDVLISLGPQTVEAGIEITRTSLPRLRVPATLLTQVFGNLLGNAIRYAGREGSPIRICGERRGSQVRFSVEDHGPGIPQDERSQIFELFYRGINNRKSSGTGVGLATVQKISRLYSGQSWMEETPGGGSTFFVELTDA